MLHKAGEPNVKPNAVTFNTVISAWAKSGDPLAGSKVETILAQMKELHDAGDTNLRPNAVTYTCIISAWANAKSRLGAERACAYLEHMKNLAAAGQSECNPDKIAYLAVIGAWAKSGHPDTVSTVKRLEQEMSRLSVWRANPLPRKPLPHKS
jgi:hypothetical protein